MSLILLHWSGGSFLGILISQPVQILHSGPLHGVLLPQPVQVVRQSGSLDWILVAQPVQDVRQSGSLLLRNFAEPVVDWLLKWENKILFRLVSSPAHQFQMSFLGCEQPEWKQAGRLIWHGKRCHVAERPELGMGGSDQLQDVAKNTGNFFWPGPGRNFFGNCWAPSRSNMVTSRPTSLYIPMPRIPQDHKHLSTQR